MSKPLLSEQIKQIFRNHYFSKALEVTLKEVEKDVLKILEDYAIKPYVLTLCDKCNKEFQIEIEEQTFEWVAVFARCPHCNHSNHRWLRIPKKESKFVVVEKQKLQEKLFRLMCLRAGSIYFSDEENGMKILLLELLTGKKFKNRREIDAFLNVARMCKSVKEAREKFAGLMEETEKEKEIET